MWSAIEYVLTLIYDHAFYWGTGVSYDRIDPTRQVKIQQELLILSYKRG